MRGTSPPAGERVTDLPISRRQFIGYVIAASTLVTAADLRAPQAARAAVPTTQPVDLYDLSDLLNDAGRVTLVRAHDEARALACPLGNPRLPRKRHRRGGDGR